MKILFPILVCCLASVTALPGCKKADDHYPTPQASIVISKPMAGQLFHKGDTVVVEATITSDANLHGYKLAITTAAGDTVFAADDHAHARTLSVAQNWVNTLQTATELAVHIKSDIDHDGNTVQKEVKIKTAP